MEKITSAEDLALFEDEAPQDTPGPIFERVRNPEDIALFDEGPQPAALEEKEPDVLNRILNNITGTASDIGEAYGQRTQKASDAMSAYAAGNQMGEDPRQGIGSTEMVTRIAGNSAAFVGDMVWEAVTGAAQTGWTVLPQSFRADISQEARDAAEALGKTSVGKGVLSAIETGGEAFEWAKKNYPEEVETMMQTLNVAVAGRLKNQKVGPPDTVPSSVPFRAETGKVTPQDRLKALESVNRQPGQTLKGREADLWKIVEDTSTAGQRAATENMTPGGLGFIPKQRILTPYEEDLLKAVDKVPNISSAQTWQHNFNNIRERSRQLGSSIERSLKDLEAPVSVGQVQSRLNEAVNKIANELPAVTGTVNTGLQSSLKKFEDMANQALQFMDTNGHTAYGVYKARQEFDNLYRKLAQRAYDSGESMPQMAEESYKAIRGVFNNIVDELDGGATRALRKEQSLLIEAGNRVLPKATQEANTALGRMYQRLGLVDAATPFGVVQNLIYKTALVGLSPVYFSGRGFQKIWKAAPVQTQNGRAAYVIRNMVSEAKKAMTTLSPEARKEMALDIKVAMTVANQLERESNESSGRP